MNIVLHDMPGSAAPLRKSKASFMYLRFHGPEKGYRGSYTDAVLFTYAEYIKAWRYEGKEVYVYFNNTAGDAFNNVTTFNQYLAEMNE